MPNCQTPFTKPPFVNSRDIHIVGETVVKYRFTYYTVSKSCISVYRQRFSYSRRCDSAWRNAMRSISETSSCFFGPRSWHIEIRHRVKKTSTINLFGFETLKIRRLKIMETDRVASLPVASRRVAYYMKTFAYIQIYMTLKLYSMWIGIWLQFHQLYEYLGSSGRARPRSSARRGPFGTGLCNDDNDSDNNDNNNNNNTIINNSNNNNLRHRVELLVWRYLSNTASSVLCVFRRVKEHRNLLLSVFIISNRKTSNWASQILKTNMLLICPYCLKFQIARVSAAKTNLRFENWPYTLRHFWRTRVLDK